MTLIELTVVILVLLSLISILFVGARAWKRGSDRAGCIMNIRNVQQGMRSYQNMNGHAAGETVPGALREIIGPGKGTYSFLDDELPLSGALYMTCSLASMEKHVPSDYADW